MTKDYKYDWWETNLRCPICQNKVWFDKDIKPHVKNWKLENLPKRLIIDCPTYRSQTPHKLTLDIFIDVGIGGK